MFVLLLAYLRQIIFVPHEQQISRHLHKDLFLDEKTMPHVYVIILAASESAEENPLFGPSPDQ